jgi:cytochrome c5
MKIRRLACWLLLLPVCSGAAWCGKHETHDRHATTRSAAKARPMESGELIFQQNCARCHQPPMSLSPRITGTVVMHMRVRARLSRDQERELLRYLAP